MDPKNASVPVPVYPCAGKDCEETLSVYELRYRGLGEKPGWYGPCCAVVIHGEETLDQFLFSGAFLRRDQSSRRTQVRACAECGADISQLNHRAKRCAPCAKDRRLRLGKARARRMNKLSGDPEWTDWAQRQVEDFQRRWGQG